MILLSAVPFLLFFSLEIKTMTTSTSTALTVFDYSSTLQVKVMLDKDNTVWFVARDLTKFLGYSRVYDALRSLDEQDKWLVLKTDNILNGIDIPDRGILLISFYGLRYLLHVSKKKNVSRFSFWVEHTLLPQLGNPKIPFRKPLTSVVTSLYVVLFSHGVIKVGKAVNPVKRLADYYKTSAIYGRKIVGTYIENNPGISEEMLLSYCRKKGNVYIGNEYFKNISFDKVVRYLKKTSKDIHYLSAKKFFSNKEKKLYSAFLKKLHIYCLKHQIKINFLYKDSKKIRTYPLLILKEVWKLVLRK